MNEKNFSIKIQGKTHILNKHKLKLTLEKITNEKINTENFYTIKKLFKKYSLNNNEFINFLK